MTAISAPALPLAGRPARPLASRPAAPRLRITPRGRAVVTVLIAAPLALGAVAFGLGQVAAASDGSSAASSTQQPALGSSAYHWVTVRAGESLWSIARRVAPAADPRDVVAAIVDLNQLESSSVSAGQQLAIPTAYDR